MLVKLTDTINVNPIEVSSIVVNHEYDSVSITMNNGSVWHLGCDYGKSAYETADRITKLINGGTNG